MNNNEKSTLYEQRDIFVPRKHHALYRASCNPGEPKPKNIHRLVYSNNWKTNGSFSTLLYILPFLCSVGGGPRVVVSNAAFHARVWGSVPGLGGLKETKIVSSPSMCEN